VRALDHRGTSALQLAERHGHEEAAGLLRHPGRVPHDDMTLRYAYDASGAPVAWPDLSDLSLADMQAVTGPSHRDFDTVRERVGDDSRRSFARSSQDELAIEAAAHTGAAEIARYHLDHGVPQSLVTSISIGDLDRARRLLAIHPNAIHERGPHDFAPMFYPAIAGGSVEAAELLLDAGCDVDQESQGTTGLHWAAAQGHLDLARLLVERGATIDAIGYNVDREGRTPLQSAQASGRDAMVRLLRDLGAG
jgi:ankyrin repeat protein